MPLLTDLVALLGIDLVLCWVCCCLLPGKFGAAAFKKWLIGIVFVALWIPVGGAHLPLVAWVRGISSDPSITLIMLAGLGLSCRLSGMACVSRREVMPVWWVATAAGVVLYPFALGLTDWDAYRPGWGSPGMLLGLLLVAAICWARGLRFLPMLIATALLAWCAGLLESTNLWDYLLDPWLVLAGLFQTVRGAVLGLYRRLGRARQ